jgi:hypothetical protein
MSRSFESLPRIDLRRQLEASLPTALAADLAGEADWPPAPTDEALRADGVAAAFATVRRALSTPETLQAAGRGLVTQARHEHIIHSEVFVDPVALGDGGMPPEQALDALSTGLEEALEDEPRPVTSVGLVVTLSRDADVQQTAAWLERAAALEGMAICGLHLGEGDAALSAWAPVLALAREARWKTSADAPHPRRAAGIDEALQAGIDRVHGALAATRNDATALQLRARRVPIIVTPTIDVRLGRARDLARHPMLHMLHGGMLCIAASGWPALAPPGLQAVYDEISRALGWRMKDMRNNASRAAEAAAVPADFGVYLGRVVDAWQPSA